MKFSDFEIIKTSGEQHGNITHEDYITRSGKRYPEKEVVGVANVKLLEQS